MDNLIKKELLDKSGKQVFLNSELESVRVLMLAQSKSDEAIIETLKPAVLELTGQHIFADGVVEKKRRSHAFDQSMEKALRGK